ncbi:MAG: DUF554 domain-containing protein [Fimbriimonas sp.]|nr:DUF554 domain-containing protein [Fimbriimonas sp.]
MRGTLLNTATVATGATVGWLVGKQIPGSYQTVALHGLGLVTCGLGVKMFLQSRNPLIAALAMAGGGVIGLAIGIHAGIGELAEWFKHSLGQGSSPRFVDGLITSFVLFCIGPMTLLGCMQDALEKKSELLSLKATMDGVAAVFLAAASGAGVLVTALLLLIYQGALTLAAGWLRPIAADEELLAETTATGGAILFATGLGLLEIKDLHTANYLPAVFFAPAAVMIGRKLPWGRKPQT